MEGTMKDNGKSIRSHLIYGVTIIAIIGVFSFLLYKSDKPGSLRFQIGDNELEISLEGDTLTIKNMLDHLFKDETTKRESSALLKEFGSFYQPSDPGLVEVIEQQDIESEVAKKLRHLLYDLKGPFERSTHTFYDVEDVHIVDAIEKLGFDHAVAKELRELLIYKKGPFEEQTIEIIISAPSENRIAAGRAASCNGSKFYKREIRIFNLQRTNSISAYVSESFPCLESDKEEKSEIGKLIQISSADMKNLMGDSPLGENKPGIAEILIDTQ
jgi:hypothetical protein